MKKFLVLSLLCVSGWSIAQTEGHGPVYTIINSTSAPIYVDTTWFKGLMRVSVSERVDAGECVYLRRGYCDRRSRDAGYSEHNCIDWIFERLAVNVENRSFNQVWLEDLQVVEDRSFFDRHFFSFKLLEVQVQDEQTSCKVFIPDQAVFIGGDGNTLLHDAVQENNLAETERLIHRGASINMRNKDGFTALDLARAKEYPEMVSLLSQYGGKSSVDLTQHTILFK